VQVQRCAATVTGSNTGSQDACRDAMMFGPSRAKEENMPAAVYPTERAVFISPALGRDWGCFVDGYHQQHHLPTTPISDKQ